MVAFLLDIAYILVLIVAAPWLAFKAVRSGKYRTGLSHKLFGLVPARSTGRPCVWFHAVSVGEVMLLRRIVAAVGRQRPDVEFVISTTTNTGMEVARQHFTEHTLIYFPLDFSWAVRRAVARIRPDVVALAELELWPNFIDAAKRLGVPICVINGRMSPRSHRGYRRVRWFMRTILAKIDAFAIQNDEFAQRFIDAGAPAERVVVTGSVKYDGIETDRSNPKTSELRGCLGIRTDDLVWVAGSTSEPEESIVLDAYEQMRVQFPSFRLIVVPRHKERFDEVSRLLESRGHRVLRRSRHQAVERFEREANPVVLVDTLGELSSVWGLADIAFVGGTFAPRGGQNMIEPAGYGAAVVVGPGVWNFQDTVDHLLACRGIVQVSTAGELRRVVETLARDVAERHRMGQAARSFVRNQHGATERTVHLVERLLPMAARRNPPLAA
jgi:3-deoxy-D-manno-octulosonic-acid transferase